jgi:hypothetical protein
VFVQGLVQCSACGGAARSRVLYGEKDCSSCESRVWKSSGSCQTVTLGFGIFPSQNPQAGTRKTLAAGQDSEENPCLVRRSMRQRDMWQRMRPEPCVEWWGRHNSAFACGGQRVFHRRPGIVICKWENAFCAQLSYMYSRYYDCTRNKCNRILHVLL